MGATYAEKSTIQTGALNAVSANVPTVDPTATTALPAAPKVCLITDPDCEACQ
jgi:ribonucleoside-diphosphate reductase alpha chain